MSIADRLTELANAKNNMKAAIESKGVSPTGGLSTYADAIRSIEQQEINIDGGVEFDFTKWGWSSSDSNNANKLTPLALYNLTEQTKELEQHYNGGKNHWWQNSSNIWYCDFFATFTDVIVCPKIGNIKCGNAMFQSCSLLQYVPELDLSGAFNKLTCNMFNGCKALWNIPKLNTTGIYDMYYMFNECRSLTTIPEMDTSAAKDMRGMFRYCVSLDNTGNLDYSSATKTDSMFYHAGLTTIGPIDFSNIESAAYMFRDVGNRKNKYLLTINGLTNIGKQKNFDGTQMFYTDNGIILHDQFHNIVEGLYDRAKAGYSDGNLQFSAGNCYYNWEDLNAATDKGWIISFI